MWLRNPIYTADGRIDCEVNHPELGWIPFTASLHDVEPTGREIYAAALEMGPSDYVEADPARVLQQERDGMVASRFQAMAALLQAGLLDQAKAAVGKSSPIAQLAWSEATEFRRNGPMMIEIANGLGLSDDQIDDLFLAAMAIQV